MVKDAAGQETPDNNAAAEAATDLPATPDTIEGRIAALGDRIRRAAHAAGRDPAQIRVLLATKTQSADGIAAAVAAARATGLRVLVGENRVQELTNKAPAFASLDTDVHLIGPLQSNKVNAALSALREATAPGRLAGIESIDSLSLATRIATRHAGQAPLDIMVQVNTARDEFKSGVHPDALAEIADGIADLPTLRLTGLMTIGPRSRDQAETRAAFADLRDLRDGLVQRGHTSATELSMGMSGDLDWAIECGATIVRPGTAVFGARPAL